MSGLIRGEVVVCHLGLSTSNQKPPARKKVRQDHSLIGDCRSDTLKELWIRLGIKIMDYSGIYCTKGEPSCNSSPICTVSTALMCSEGALKM